MDHAALLTELPPPYRLALAYAPKRARGLTFGLLALDARLGGVVRAAREPMLAQLKLAWWRDRLTAPPQTWPTGEPLLALLTDWGGAASELGGLVDGWEAVLLESDPAELAAARARACAALAEMLDLASATTAAGEAAQRWTIAEFGDESGGEALRLPKELRALAVLVRLLEASGQSKLNQFIGALRTGLFG